MKFLLDTHSFLWYINGHPNLSLAARDIIEDASSQPFLSVASLWEIAIKISLGKLSLAQPFEVIILEQMNLNGIQLLSIELPHLAIVAKLPFHHRDPFDRLIIAQAIVEGIPIVGADHTFDSYSINRLW